MRGKYNKNIFLLIKNLFIDAHWRGVEKSKKEEERKKRDEDLLFVRRERPNFFVTISRVEAS